MIISKKTSIRPLEWDEEFIWPSQVPPIQFSYTDTNTVLTWEKATKLDKNNLLSISSQLQEAEIIFSDLDNTLVQSKYPMTSEMAQVFSELLKIKKIVIVTWGTIETIVKNVLGQIKNYCTNDQLWNLVLLPLLWNETWEFDDNTSNYEKIWEIERSVILPIHIAALEKGINMALDEFWRPNVPFELDDVIEKRGVDTTKFMAISYFWQNVPHEYAHIKDTWDSDRKKREDLIQLIYKHLDPKYKEWWMFHNLFDFRTGWSTSIDITIRWFDKGSWLENFFLHRQNIQRKDTIFLGDSFTQEWNDEPILRTGVLGIDVWDQNKTLALLQKITS